jgi:hypothetical protein
MKKILISFITLFAISQLATAQTKSYEELARTQMRMDKKDAIASVMVLNDSMAKIFWPLYNQYEMAYSKLMDDRIAIIEDFAHNFKSMSDAKATELMNRSFANKDGITDLMKAWSKKFTKAVGAQKTLTFMQAENKILVLVDYSLASDIPLYQK